MNLVSSEFIACQKAEKGVLILSEVNQIYIVLMLIFYESNMSIMLKSNLYLYEVHSLQVLDSHLVLELFL